MWEKGVRVKSFKPADSGVTLAFSHERIEALRSKPRAQSSAGNGPAECYTATLQSLHRPDHAEAFGGRIELRTASDA